MTRQQSEDPYTQSAAYPGCSGTRTWKDNDSDLKAAVAANHKGALLLQSLVRDSSLELVHFYMRAINENAESAVRHYLKQVGQQCKGIPLRFVD